MDFSFTEEQTSIRQAIREILADLVTDESLKALEKSGSSFHEVAWKALAEAEMLGIAIPEAYGGAAFGFMELCLLLDEVGRTVAPIPALPTLVSAALPIAAFGTDEQKERLLPGGGKGEIGRASCRDRGSTPAGGEPVHSSSSRWSLLLGMCGEPAA